MFKKFLKKILITFRPLGRKVRTLVITLLIIVSLNGFGPLSVLAQTFPTPPTAPTPPPAPTNPQEPPPPPLAPTPPPAPWDGQVSTQDSGTNNSSNNSNGQTGSASANGLTAENSGNGANSQNLATVESLSETILDLQNKANVLNNLDFSAITGDNTSSRNTGGLSSIRTGDSNLNGVISTNVNSTQVSGGGCCSGSTSAVNSDNGAGSQNSANASSSSSTTANIGNDAQIATEIVGLSLTGSNDASRNTGGDSEIITGDANLGTTVVTGANSAAFGVYQFDVNGNQTGDIILGENLANCVNCSTAGSGQAINSGNGADSTNTATASSSNTTTETITNVGDIVNNIYLTANSGDNEASRNTGGDSTVVTGDANVAANVVNTLNTSITNGVIYTVNVFGNLVGNIILPDANATSGCGSGEVTAANSGNGADSQNTATTTSANETTITQTNQAEINNNLALVGNTGDNDVNFNTAGDSVVDTGTVQVSANVSNVANINVAGTGSPCDPPVHIVLINKIGDWIGQILGLPEGTYVLGTDGSIYVVGPGGALIAVNSGNGAGSTNTATATSNNTTNITQTNTGSIANNIYVTANTGGNEASRNTGGNSSITTGDANIIVNVINFINSNFSGRKIVMTLVNVFGSWLGNLVPAGFQADSPSGGSSENSQTNSQNTNSSTNGSSSNGSTGSSSDNSSSDEEGLQDSQVLATDNSGSSHVSFAGYKISGNSGNSQVITSGKLDDVKLGGQKSFPWIYLSILGIIPAWFLVRKLKIILLTR